MEIVGTPTVYDREVKLRIYARSGVPEAWPVDLNERIVEVYASLFALAIRRHDKHALPRTLLIPYSFLNFRRCSPTFTDLKCYPAYARLNSSMSSFFI